MEVLWLISQGEIQVRSGQLAGVSKATVARYIGIFRRHRVAGLRALQWGKLVGALEAHRTTLEAEFRERPPHTVAEATERIATLTEVRRKETQVRVFLKTVAARDGVGWGHPTAPEKVIDERPDRVPSRRTGTRADAGADRATERVLRERRELLASLMTLKFQTFATDSF
ncbi:hypothetical protein R5W24_004625, partial [Gemmata sp. JC717]|nr:hypothetical protein [Gemmata algarum]